MTEIARKVTWSFVPSLAASVLVLFLSGGSLELLESETVRAIGGDVIATPLAQVIILTLALAIPSYFVVSYLVFLIKKVIQKRQETLRKKLSCRVHVRSGTSLHRLLSWRHPKVGGPLAVCLRKE